AVICGVMRSVMPTSWRSTVVKRLARLVALVARLATKGTLRPTTISASSLSVVMMLGAERTFTSVSVWSAVRSTVCAGTSWPHGRGERDRRGRAGRRGLGLGADRHGRRRLPYAAVVAEAERLRAARGAARERAAVRLGRRGRADLLADELCQHAHQAVRRRVP